MPCTAGSSIFVLDLTCPPHFIWDDMADFRAAGSVPPYPTSSETRGLVLVDILQNASSKNMENEGFESSKQRIYVHLSGSYVFQGLFYGLEVFSELALRKKHHSANRIRTPGHSPRNTINYTFGYTRQPWERL